MLPMVSNVSELVEAKKLIKDVINELKKKKLIFLENQLKLAF